MLIIAYPTKSDQAAPINQFNSFNIYLPVYGTAIHIWIITQISDRQFSLQFSAHNFIISFRLFSRYSSSAISHFANSSCFFSYCINTIFVSLCCQDCLLRVALGNSFPVRGFDRATLPTPRLISLWGPGTPPRALRVHFRGNTFRKFCKKFRKKNAKNAWF